MSRRPARPHTGAMPFPLPTGVFIVDDSAAILTNHGKPQYRSACARASAACFLDKSAEFHRVPAVIAEFASNSHRETYPG